MGLYDTTTPPFPLVLASSTRLEEKARWRCQNECSTAQAAGNKWCLAIHA